MIRPCKYKTHAQYSQLLFIRTSAPLGADINAYIQNFMSTSTLLVQYFSIFALWLLGLATINTFHLQLFQAQCCKVLSDIRLPLGVSKSESLGSEIELQHEVVTIDPCAALEIRAADARQSWEVSLLIELFEQHHHVAVRTWLLGGQRGHVVDQCLAVVHCIAGDVGADQCPLVVVHIALLQGVSYVHEPMHPTARDRLSTRREICENSELATHL